jgi:hypothetical protein
MEEKLAENVEAELCRVVEKVAYYCLDFSDPGYPHSPHGDVSIVGLTLDYPASKRL